MAEVGVGYGPGMHGTTIVSVCIGSACRRRHEPSLIDAFGDDGAVRVVPTKCLGVCKGPVAAIEAPGAKRLVLSRLRSSKSVRDAVALVRTGALSDRLRGRRVTGRARRTALARLDRRR
jgi:hypothetical protein